MELDIRIDEDWDSSGGALEPLVRRAAEAAIAESAFPQLDKGNRTVELSVRLTSDEEVRALNHQWRGKDKATNVLSFPMAEWEELEASETVGPELLLGDIVLAHGVCAREAAEKGLPLEDHAAHLMVHGTLHLLGYDHMDDESASDMEAREVRALARMGLGDPYGEND